MVSKKNGKKKMARVTSHVLFGCAFICIAPSAATEFAIISFRNLQSRPENHDSALTVEMLIENC
jgi:hypothetical protein